MAFPSIRGLDMKSMVLLTEPNKLVLVIKSQQLLFQVGMLLIHMWAINTKLPTSNIITFSLRLSYPTPSIHAYLQDI